MASVLVTGGAGFIGSHLVGALLDQGGEVVALDSFDDFYDPAVKRRNLDPYRGRPGFVLAEGDIRDERLVDGILASHRIETVVHLAARAGVRPSIQQPALYSDVNVRGTAVLLEACRKHGVMKFIFGSSSSVYGSSARVPFSENDDVSVPLSPYAATKRAGELLCATYHALYRLNVFCLRFFTVYGPRQRPEMAIGRFIDFIDRGLPLPRFGDGTSRRDYTYISDIIDGVLRAIERARGHEIINLGGARATRLSDLIALIERNLGRRAIVQALPEQPGDMVATWADTAKAHRLLGYAPRVPLEEGVSRFVAWYREGAGDAGRRPQASASGEP